MNCFLAFSTKSRSLLLPALASYSQVSLPAKLLRECKRGLPPSASPTFSFHIVCKLEREVLVIKHTIHGMRGFDVDVESFLGMWGRLLPWQLASVCASTIIEHQNLSEFPEKFRLPSVSREKCTSCELRSCVSSIDAIKRPALTAVMFPPSPVLPNITVKGYRELLKRFRAQHEDVSTSSTLFLQAKQLAIDRLKSRGDKTKLNPSRAFSRQASVHQTAFPVHILVLPAPLDVLTLEPADFGTVFWMRGRA